MKNSNIQITKGNVMRSSDLNCNCENVGTIVVGDERELARQHQSSNI